VVLGNGHVDYDIGQEHIFIDLAFLQVEGIRDFGFSKFQEADGLHLPAGGEDLLLDAAAPIGGFGIPTEGEIHHPHAPGAGFKAHAHDLSDDPRVRCRCVFVRAVIDADVGLDDHIVAGADETLHATQGGDGIADERLRLTAASDGHVRVAVRRCRWLSCGLLSLSWSVCGFKLGGLERLCYRQRGGLQGMGFLPSAG